MNFKHSKIYIYIYIYTRSHGHVTLPWNKPSAKLLPVQQMIAEGLFRLVPSSRYVAPNEAISKMRLCIQKYIHSYNIEIFPET